MWDETLQNVIIPNLNAIFQVIIYMGVPALTVLLVNWLKKLFSVIKSKTENETIQNQLDRVNSVVEQSVNFIAQTYVDALKAQGNFDTDAQKEALTQTKKIAEKMINEESKKLIDNIHGDFKQWLDTKIESVIVGNKNTQINSVIKNALTLAKNAEQ